MRIACCVMFAVGATLSSAAEPNSSTRHFVIHLDPSDRDGSAQIWYRFTGHFPGPAEGEAGGSLSPPNGKDIEIPIEKDGVTADSLTAYVYRPGCEVGYYRVDNLNKVALSAEFHCASTDSVRFQVIVKNLQDLPMSELLALVSYDALSELRSNAGRVYEHVNFNIGTFAIAQDGTVTLQIPDFGNDPRLLTTLQNGRLNVFVYDKGHRIIGALVVPTVPVQSWLPVLQHYPPQVPLIFSTSLNFQERIEPKN